MTFMTMQHMTSICKSYIQANKQPTAVIPMVGQEKIFVGPGDFLVHYPKKFSYLFEHYYLFELIYY